MGWYDYDHMSGWGWAGMALSWILLLGLIVLGVLLLVRLGRRTSDSPTAPARESAEQVLAERFARGEIDEDEYRRRLATLRGAGTGGR
jgi:putative membrane protein